jgi:hypothetical protein
MKKFLSFAICALLMIFGINAVAQKNLAVKTVTNAENGVTYEKEYGNFANSKSVNEVTDNLNVIWEMHEPYAIGQNVYFSNITSKNVVNWQLNDSRIAQYGETSTPEWEFETFADFTEAFANEAGTLVAVADGNMLYVIDPSTGNLILEQDMVGNIAVITPYPDGTGIYIGVNDRNGANYAEAYLLNNMTTPVWSFTTENGIVEMNVSDGNEHLVVCVAAPMRAALIVNPVTGDILQNLYYYNNSPTAPPAFSSGGEYLAYADFSGFASLYKYEDGEYRLVWKASVQHENSSSTWGCGVDISADGSTIAVGTLGFITNGYMGSVYVFNNYSAEPLWAYHDCGDEVPNISITDDGSLIACATYGPINNSSADLLIFRRQSAVPVAELSTTGVFEFIDIAPDGSCGIAAGKGVHPREMGYGGQAYYFVPKPNNSGTLDGTVNLVGTDDNSKAVISVNGIDDYFDYSDENGEFIVKYIPVGTYTVTVSKTGYYPQIIDNVTITADNTTTISAELQPTGNFITDLFATQGIDVFVKLSWSELADNNDGYNIYRKRYEQDPFTTAIGTVEAGVTEFYDETAVPTYEYYYAVTAIIDDNVESPYSNVALGYTSTHFITYAIDAFDGEAPVIDGVMSEGEWNDAYEVESSDFLGIDGGSQPVGSVKLYFKVCGEKLYVASVNENDNQLNTNDRVAFYMDDNNDGAYEPQGDDSEGNYWMDYVEGGPNTIRYRPIYDNQSVGTTITLENTEFEASDATGHVVMEFALPIGGETYEITPNEQNMSGLYYYVRNAAMGNYDGLWPCDNTETFIPTGYGTITFYAEDEVPPPPTNLRVDDFLGQRSYVAISWDMPDINDLDYFNVSVEMADGSKEIYQVNGTQLILEIVHDVEYSVYATTVDKAGQESENSEILTFNVVGIDNVVGMTINVYPNPVKSILNIATGEVGAAEIDIYDISGKKVLTKKVQDVSNCELNVSELRQGVYFMSIIKGKVVVVEKIVKE